MAEKTIIVKTHRPFISCGGIGCIFVLVVGIAFCAIFLKACSSAVETIEQTSKEMAAREAAKTPEQRAAERIAKPDNIVVEMLFKKALRGYLNDPDSYKPGEIKFHPHRDGYAYLHAFRAKNAFGGYVAETVGLLMATNSGEIATTFYRPDQIGELMKDTEVVQRARKAIEPELEPDPDPEPDPATIKPKKIPGISTFTVTETDAEHRDRVTAKARELVAPKLKDPNSFKPRSLERRTRGSDTVWIQYLYGDGRKLRTGILEKPDGTLTRIDPKSLQRMIDTSFPE